MFCSSLRQRREFKPLLSLLSNGNTEWIERSLEHHDLAISVPQSQSKPQSQYFYRILLISRSDFEERVVIMDRIERLYHRFGGRNIGIIFILNTVMGSENALVTFMSFQASLLSSFDIPIFPTASINSVPSTLMVIKKSLAVLPKHSSALANSEVALLPFVTTNPPLPEHARNVLSDICNSIPDVAHAATQLDCQTKLREWLAQPQNVCDDIIGFWENEWGMRR